MWKTWINSCAAEVRTRSSKKAVDLIFDGRTTRRKDLTMIAPKPAYHEPGNEPSAILPEARDFLSRNTDLSEYGPEELSWRLGVPSWSVEAALEGLEVEGKVTP